MTTTRPGARELIDIVLDAGSWTSWDEPMPSPAAPGSDYAQALADAAAKAGTDESVLTGRARLRGHDVAVVVGEFAFLAGSIGSNTSRRIVEAVERATAEGLPLLAAPASGGTRMQEGTRAFVGMVRIADALRRHREAGLPYLTYLRHPTTGGTLASWGSLGHFTVGEPGALIGFLGPRVYEALYGEPFPPGVQVAENLHEKGILDAVLPVEEIGAVTARLLDIVSARGAGPAAVDGASASASTSTSASLTPRPAWDSVLASRHAGRPGVRTLLNLGATRVVTLHGTGQGEADRSLSLALATFGDEPCVVLGQDRHHQTLESPMGPGALRVARRGMQLAAELRLPLVSIIDTPGAALSRAAEEGGLAGEIARCLGQLVGLHAPTVCLLLGEGTGGGALALLPADRVIASENAWLSPLPPEGASAILHRTTERAPELAAQQRVRALDLLEDGIVDVVVAEEGDPADDPEGFCRRLSAVLEAELAGLHGLDPQARAERRWARYRDLG